MPKGINTSGMMSRWQKFVRTVRWKEFWYGKIEGKPTNGHKKVFKPQKVNLPPYPPPHHLNTSLNAAKDDVFGAPLNQSNSGESVRL